MRMDIFFDLMRLALYPNTNNMESMTLDFPLPFGPTIEEKHWGKELNRRLEFSFRKGSTKPFSKSSRLEKTKKNLLTFRSTQLTLMRRLQKIYLSYDKYFDRISIDV